MNKRSYTRGKSFSLDKDIGTMHYDGEIYRDKRQDTYVDDGKVQQEARIEVSNKKQGSALPRSRHEFFERGWRSQIDRVLGFVSSRPNWDTPPPLTRRRMCLPLWLRGGRGQTRLRGPNSGYSITVLPKNFSQASLLISTEYFQNRIIMFCLQL